MRTTHPVARDAGRLLLPALLFTIALAPSGVSAQNEPAEIELPVVGVQGEAPPDSPTGPDEGYVANRSFSATKTDTPLLETPQSVTVVTRERIEDQGATNLQDALNYAAGVRSDAYGLDSRSDNVRVRGAYPDEYRDGLRRLFGYYTSTTRIDPYMLERIEVLRGPAAMLYGQGSTAGVINMVAKRPLEQARREIGLQLGNYGRKQMQADLTGSLKEDGEWLYRLVGLGRDSDTQVDYVRDDRALLAPSLTWRADAGTSLTFQALWQRDRSGSTSQFFPWNGTVAPNPNGRIPTNRFIGEPGFDRYDSDRFEAGWLFEHRLTGQWTARQNLRFSRNEVDYWTLYSDSFTNPAAPYIDASQRVLNRFAYVENRRNRMVTADQHLEGHLNTGALRHQVLAGLDIVRFRETSQTGGGTPAPIDVYDPVYTGFTPGPLAENPKTKLSQVGFYLQDQAKLAERWIMVAGVRRDRANNEVEGSAEQVDRATSKRAGLMYLLGGGWAPYISYSESFTPIAGSDANNQRWKPLRGEQVEAGAKWTSSGKRLSFTMAWYDLREKNRQVPDPSNPFNQLQVGSTETDGIEVEVVGQLLPQLDLAAHYNYTDIDPQLEALPRHQAAAWGTYRFAPANLPGLLISGLGVRYMSSFEDGIAPTTPAVTLFDALLGYDEGRWRYAVNVQNLADKIYVSTCLSRGDCWYGARRTVIGSLTYRF